MNKSLRQAINRAWIELGIFSIVLNLCQLVPPIYMMQVYDRVLPSGGIATLVYLSLIAGGALLFMAAIELVRSLYCQRMAIRFDAELGEACLKASLASPKAASGDVQPLRDLSAVRGFIASRGLANLLDLPFAPLFAMLLFFVHPLLCVVTVAGAAVLVVLVIANQYAARKAAGKAQAAQVSASLLAQALARSSEVVQSMGMLPNVTAQWGERFAEAALLQDRAAHANAIFSAISRAFRMALQLAILGVGAVLVIRGEMTAGMIFASSIISGRTLQPIDQLVGGWRQLFDTRKAWDRLIGAVELEERSRAAATVVLPSVLGRVTAQDLLFLPANSTAGASPVIKRVSLDIRAGEAVAILGPSGAGKSTLARMLAGAAIPTAGRVLLDGGDYTNWNAGQLGAAVGYLPQDVHLLPGTIAENIARFDPLASDDTITAAAAAAEAHEMITGLSGGYQTAVSPADGALSGGMRQRVGLARALFGDPKVLVLDEPNSNLDTGGEMALNAALATARRKGQTVIIVTHRPSIVARCDRAVVLDRGAVVSVGPAVETLHRLALGAERRGAMATVGSASAGPAEERSAVSGARG